MKIIQIQWNELEPYLKKARAQSPTSLQNHKSLFKGLQSWFGDREFNAQNLSIYFAEKNKSASFENNTLKLVKHLAHYLGCVSEFEEFKYTAEPNNGPEVCLSEEQIRQLAECPESKNASESRIQRYRALIYFLGHVGSRITETLSLKWSDIIDSPIPMVHFRSEITKTGRERYCAIPKWLKEMIYELPRENEFIFCKIDQPSFRKNLKVRLEKCSLPRSVSPHSFRDSSINNKLRYGITIQDVGRYHGHVKIDTTYRYYAMFEAEKMAYRLYEVDPAYKEDETFEINSQSARLYVEKIVNPRVSKYEYKSFTDKNNKLVLEMRIIEK